MLTYSRSLPMPLLPRLSLPRRLLALRARAERLDPVLRAMIWSGLAGLQFVCLNAIMRGLSLQLGGFEVQFLRYLAGVIILIPWVLRTGVRQWVPLSVPGQFARGAVHTGGLILWFMAVTQVSLADLTAINFTGPLWIMLGASVFLGEPMRMARWVATVFGLVGVLLVVAPKLSGQGGFYMLLLVVATVIFAGSYLLSKALTRHERPEVIVAWQSLTVACLSLPLVLVGEWRTPTAGQWALLLLCGVIGTSGHYCLTRSYKAADISATQSVKFLDLIWASALGWLLFGDMPTAWTLAGGAVIATSTVWLARREARAG